MNCRKINAVLMVCVFAVGVMAGSAVAQDMSLEEIVAAHVDALGGKGAIAKVDNIKSRSKVTIKSGFGDMSGTAEEIIDIKGKRRYVNHELSQFKKTEAMVGDAGWTKGTEGDRDMTTDEIAIAKLSLNVSPVVSAYRQVKNAVELQGNAEFGGMKCHVISVGPEVQYFIGKESSLLVGMEIAGVGVVTLKDYEKVNGVMFPAARTIEIEAQGITIDYKMRYTKINVEIDDELFGDLADADGDSAPVYTADQVMGFLDKDGDKKISREEAKASPELSPAFDLVDANKDGFIDMAETKSMIEYTKNQQSAKNAKKKSKEKGLTPKQVIAMMDKNNDGKISKSESNAELQPFFNEIDVNEDGFVDEKEAKVIVDYANARGK